jgi:ribosomal protein S18 acetylase RimI-like enzyme
MLRPAFLAGLLDRFCRWTYRRASSIVVLSRGFKDRLCELGVSPNRIHVVYNWTDEEATLGEEPQLDDPGSAVFKEGSFHVLYAGSMGPLQGLAAVLEAAAILQASDPSVRFLLVGDGVERDALEAHAERLGLTNTVFVPRQPSKVVTQLMRRADALVVHLKETALSRGAIPQKTQVYLAAARPILCAIAGEAAELVERADAGMVCRPDDPGDLAQAVVALARLTPCDREAMGHRGRRFYDDHLSFARGCARMADILQDIEVPRDPSQSASIQPLNETDLPRIVDLHRRAFEGFFLSALGPRFLRQYYRAVLRHEGGICLGAFERDQLVGFAAGFVNPPAFYRSLREARVRMGLAAMPPLITNPLRAVRLITNYRRTGQAGAAHHHVQSSELASLAVDRAVEGRGIGGGLVRAFAKAAADLGAPTVTLTTDAVDNDPVNRFYSRLGFSLQRTFESQPGRLLNEYSACVLHVSRCGHGGSEARAS